MKKQRELALIKAEDEIGQAEAQIVELSKRIEFYLTEYSVELLASKMSKGEFVVPAYQREYTWEHDRKSRFIESLSGILGKVMRGLVADGTWHGASTRVMALAKPRA